MLDLRLYRLAFAPALAALVICAFSLDGVPEPIEPEPVTLTFEGGRAAATAREIVALGDDRTPGSAADSAAADLVRERFSALEAGSVSEQAFEADVDGSERVLRNVILTLPGTSERTLVVLAGRDSRAGPGATSSAAATALLVELAQHLGVAGRERTLILASTGAASAESEGAHELVEALPEPELVDGVLVIAQPSAAETAAPHLVVSSTEERAPALELVRTAEAQLEERAEVPAGLAGPFGQLARLALPGAAGEQAALNGAGFDAVAFSSAGELPVQPEADDPAALDPALLTDYGSAVLATLGALNARPGGLEPSPDAYVRFSGNIVPGWAITLLALTLLLPPAAISVSELARAARRGEHPARAWRWAAAWLTPVGAAVAIVYLLGLVGLVPSPSLPYDPGRFDLGPAEALALALVAGSAIAVWWALGLRRVPAGPERATLAAACGAVATLAAGALWVANPYLALLAVPVVHLPALHALRPEAARRYAIPVAVAAIVPVAAALAHVAGALDWGLSTPWQMVLLLAGGGAGPLETAALLALLAAGAALVWATVSPASSRGRPPQGEARIGSAEESGRDPTLGVGENPESGQGGRVLDTDRDRESRMMGSEGIPMSTTLAPPPLNETTEQRVPEDNTMAELKTQIAQRDYSVDAELVAEEILRKLRLVRWARRELVSGTGRTPGRPAPGH